MRSSRRRSKLQESLPHDSFPTVSMYVLVSHSSHCTTLTICAQRWRRKTQESRAISFHRRSVQSQVIHRWIHRYHRAIDLVASIEVEVERKELETKAIVFDAWSNRARELTIEREIISERNSDTLRECWGTWVERTSVLHLSRIVDFRADDLHCADECNNSPTISAIVSRPDPRSLAGDLVYRPFEYVVAFARRFSKRR